MSGNVAETKRLLRVDAEDIRIGQVCLDGHSDFFSTSFRASARGHGRPDTLRIEMLVDGLNKTVTAEITLVAEAAEAKLLIRSQDWIADFYEYHRTRTGDVLALERVGRRKYRIRPFDAKRDRDLDWHRHLEESLPAGSPTVLEIFAGCGGMMLGFERSGFSTVLANEWDVSCCATIQRNLTERVAQCAIQDIDEFPQADVVAGGPPCQGFSNLGERVPHDPRRQLWRQFMRAVEDASPRCFVMENVPPILGSQEFAEIRRMAESLGFCVDARVLNSADYGTPQTRRRAIIVGVRGASPSLPEPTHFDPAREDLSRDGLAPWITVRDAIGDLPFEPDGRNWHVGRNPTPKSIERYKHIPPGGNRWDLPDHLMPDCWRKKTKGGTDLFGRLWWDRPSVTIRTEFYKPEKGRYLHPEADRAITHREAARLQGFPDDFEFVGSRTQVGIQIGNAVPPPLAEAVARHIAGILADTDAPNRITCRRSGGKL